MSDEANALLRLICLDYHGSGHPERWPEAREMLVDKPALAGENIYIAAALGCMEEVRRLLAREPSVARAKGGPFGWEPLLYLCYGRLIHDGTPQDFLGTARLLLENGADPNAHFWWEDLCKFTAVTGAFGEGEGGPENLPPHPQSLALARVLLEAGADPNDGQALYNTMLRPGTTCLEMMLEFGLCPANQLSWDIGQPMGTVDYMLWKAVDVGNAERVQCLLRHGADPKLRPDQRYSLYQLATRMGHDNIARLLEAAGAGADVTPVDLFHGALCRQDLTAAAGTWTQHRPVLEEGNPEDLEIIHHLAAHNRSESLGFLLDRGWNVNLREQKGYQHTPLHKAAMNGHWAIAKLLWEKGADLKAEDATYKGTPAGWARHHGHLSLAEALEASLSTELAEDQGAGIGDYTGAGSNEDHRPWGFFEILSDRTDHKVKRITVFPGQRLSYQRHFRRSEHWFVVQGMALVTVGDEEVPLQTGRTIDLPVGTWHRVRNLGPKNLVFIEVQTGDYFGEDDIERAEDDYGRA